LTGLREKLPKLDGRLLDLIRSELAAQGAGVPGI
jgi:hypothetical protein